MTRTCILVAALLAVSQALPMKSSQATELVEILSHNKELGRNAAIENIIIGVLEQLRGVMLTGSDDIPVLDPFVWDQIIVDDQLVPLPNARLEINDLVVSHLSTFEATEVNVNTLSVLLQRYRIQVEIQVPVIDVDVGNYDLAANVMGLSVFGNGDAKISIVKPRVRVDTEVNVRLGLGAVYLNIRSLRIEFGLEDFQPAIKGLFGLPAVDDFVNLFLRNLVLEFAELYMADFSDIISPIAMREVNNFLADLNLIDLIG